MLSLNDSAGFVELNRRFRKLQAASDREDAALESYTAEVFSLSRYDSSLGWDNLLENRLTVVLGEAGSGKTWEFRQRADVLSRDGKYALFIPLEALASRPLVDSLDAKKRQQFEVWKRGNKEGIFFADSVDEAKFRRIDDFLSALDRLSDAISGDFERARVLLSCRISEWRPETDAAEVIRRFRQPRLMRQKNG